MRYWWVNHAQTARQELAGGYLWSPKAEASGARSKFYDNMRLAGPGDLILSYFNTRVARVGIVADFALTAPKPEEFGTVGAYWSSTGWLLPVGWLDAELAVAPKAILPRLAPLLPPSHSPIRAATGDGNQKAYLAEVDRAVANLVLAEAGIDLRAVEVARPASTITNIAERLDDIVEHAIMEDDTLASTVRQQLASARRGQGEFRRRVLEREPECRLTGISKPNLLIASHVKPWRACSSATERLDGSNGLMLTPDADFLFDRGLLTFEDDGRALFSPRLDERDLDGLGLRQRQRPPPRPFGNAQLPYLAHHRMSVFIP